MGTIGVDFFVGLILGLILGFIIGFLAGSISSKSEKKKRTPPRKDKAKKLFDLAVKQESEANKIKIMSKIVAKYPRSEWADRALEEAMKLRKRKK